MMGVVGGRYDGDDRYDGAGGRKFEEELCEKGMKECDESEP